MWMHAIELAIKIIAILFTVHVIAPFFLYQCTAVFFRARAEIRILEQKMEKEMKDGWKS